jgi:PIN domain nuclease of toxin-antitoxin system
VGSESVIVLDTHVLVWWLSDPKRLSARARRAIGASAAKNEVAVSAMSIFEIATLMRRGRIVVSIAEEEWLAALRSVPELVVEPISTEIAWLAGMFDAAFPGDPADRIIAATARLFDARLVTADEKLRASDSVDAIW